MRNQALVSSLLNLGVENTSNWSEAVVKNFAKIKSDRSSQGYCCWKGDIAIVNSYYIGLLLSSEKRRRLKLEMLIFCQLEVHINVSGLALTKMHQP